MHAHQLYLEKITGAPAGTEFNAVLWTDTTGVVTWDEGKGLHKLTKTQATHLAGDPEAAWLERDEDPEPV